MFLEKGFWQENFGKMLITDKQDKIIGEIFYFKVADYRVGYELGYQIYKREDRGKGYMTEALLLFSAYLFAIKPIPRLQITVIVGNESSRKVAENCGYCYEGTLRNAAFHLGKYVDLELVALLRENCMPLK